MPWKITEQKGRYCVVNKDTGATVKCHDSKSEATAHMSALYANEPTAAQDWEKQMAWVRAAFEEDFPFGRGLAKVVTEDGSVREFRCAVASTPEQKARGMVGRTFDGFEAMLFAYSEPVQFAFHMHGVPVQLHIAFFDAAGACVDHVGMFTSDPWDYKPSVPYQWALEMPVAQDERFDWLDRARLETHPSSTTE